MAAYAELRALVGDDATRQRVEVACVIKATGILKSASPTTGQKAYALSVLSDFAAQSRAIWMYVLGDNASATTAQITGSTDAQIQTKVDAAMDVLKGS